jgi:hypothetical protein
MILCRMLFTRRGKHLFRRPQIGEPFFGGEVSHDWPLAPIALIDGVPFLVVDSYFLRGSSETAKEYLAYCLAECDWSPVHYTEKKPSQLGAALEKLLADKNWQRKIKDREKNFLTDQIQ